MKFRERLKECGREKVLFLYKSGYLFWMKMKKIRDKTK